MSLPRQLTLLESSGLILLAQLQPEVEYLFRHALVQEAAYHSLVRVDRRRLHHAVGETLEGLYPASLDSPDLAPVLARHFAEAGDRPRALRYYTLAAHAAAGMYANAEAIHHYGQALALAQAGAADGPGDGPAIVDLFLRRGRVLEVNAQDDEALTNYAALEAWAVARDDRPAQLAALAARATIYVKPSVAQNLALGYDLSQRTLALSRALGDRPAEAKALWNLLQYFLAVGKVEEALTHGEMALAIAREQNLREQTAYVLGDLLKVYFQTDRMDQARAALIEARAVWRELGVLDMLADNLATAGMMQVMGGNYAQALAHSQEADQISRDIGNLWNQAYARYMIDLIHFDRGDIAQAIEVAETKTRLSDQAGFAEGINQGVFDLALIYAYMGRRPRAFEIVHQHLARAETLAGALPALPQFEGLMALLLVLDGRLDEAQAALDKSSVGRDPAELKQQFILTQFIFVLVKTELALAQGEYAQAAALAEEIAASLRQNGVRLFLADALLLRGRALCAAGQTEPARSALEEARAEAEDLGSRRSLWLILAELASLEAGQGEAHKALALRRQAADIIDYIAAQAGQAELAESFLNRPEVRRIRE